MEVHMSRVAHFTGNGDNLSQIQTGSARRRSHTQDTSYRDMQGETSSQRGNLHVRPYTHNQKSSTMKTAHTQDNPPSSFVDSNLRFGVIPQELHSRLFDLEDYKSRTCAIEELKFLIQDCDFSSLIHSDVVALISCLCNLLDDKNFTVVHVTLDVLNCLVINLGQDVDVFLPHVIASTVKLLGDSKITIKQEYMKIYMRLMKVVGPFKVLTTLLENLKHKYSRVREEVVNICIISLLTYPSEDFNLPFLACEIAPCLIDGKRKVRHAALEAFAVLAASMGPGKSSLLKAVDAVELQENGDGLMNAVQARLARKNLPKINSQGLIEYALPFPSSAQSRVTHHLPGADTDWLLTGNRVNSGQYQPGDHNGRSMVPHIDPVARRILSAGKGKNKLPWETQYPGALDGFLGTSVVLEPDQCSSRFDNSHTPIVKTPTAKNKNSSGNQTPRDFSTNSDQPAISDIVKNESPIRLKAAMVKIPSARKDLNRTRPVPPITKVATSLPDISSFTTSQTKNEFTIFDKSKEDEKIGIDLLDLSMKDEDDHEEMNSSLRNVRNSAAKKRAKMTGSLSDLESPDLMKMEMNLDSPTMSSSPMNGSYSESGVYSRESLNSPLSPMPQIRKLSDVTVVSKSKARPPRLPSPRSKETSKKTDNTNQGTSTYEKPVRVIGQRMSYRNGTVDTEEDHIKDNSTGPARYPPRDPQKPLKPMRGITASTSSFQQISFYDFDLTNAEDSVAIVGKGVFESPLPVSQAPSQSSFLASEDTSVTKQNIQPPTGVYGRAVQQNSSTVESETKVTMSKSARDKMRQKKERSLKELLDLKDDETRAPSSKERLSQTDPSSVPIERWRPKSDNLENTVDISSPTLKRTSSLKKSSAQRHYRERRSSITRSSEVVDPSMVKELSKPESSVAEALRLLADDDWEKKIEGLSLVRSLSVFHSDLVIERLHDMKLAVTQEVKNLRSSVSRAAIVCLGDMFIYLKKNMDYELDNCARVLLHKAGDSNIFIREDVDKALDAMVQNVTPVRALNALLNGGLGHLNNAVKKCTAQHLSYVVEKMGPGRILSGIKDITDRTLPAIAKFAQDGSQETRYYGRKMLHFLMSHPDIDKMLDKYIPTKDLPYLRDVMKNIQHKGVGEIQDTPSARGRRSYHGSVGSLRASSVSQNTHAAFESSSHREMKSP
ncbi:TOG array regulator of axonemal microtubules protein 1 [Discoglossus pictus]